MLSTRIWWAPIARINEEKFLNKKHIFVKQVLPPDQPLPRPNSFCDHPHNLNPLTIISIPEKRCSPRGFLLPSICSECTWETALKKTHSKRSRMPSEHQGGGGWILWFFFFGEMGGEGKGLFANNYGFFFFQIFSFHFTLRCFSRHLNHPPPSRFSILIFFSPSIQPPQCPPLPLNPPFPLRRPRHVLGSRGKVLGAET